MENRELHPNLQAALQLVEGIFQMLGSRGFRQAFSKMTAVRRLKEHFRRFLYERRYKNKGPTGR